MTALPTNTGINLRGLDTALGQFAQQLEKKREIDQYNKIFAANPQLAGQYYGGLQGMREADYLDQQRQREEQKQEALRVFAERLGGAPTGINPSGQADLETALSQYAQITGDPSSLLNYRMKRETQMQDPAAIRTTQWYLNASPEQRQAYDRVNKVGTDRVDVGNEIIFTDKVTGQVVARVPKQLAPSELPETKAAQAQAVADVDLEMKPKIEQETKFAAEVGKDLGEAQAQYSTLKASYPQLIDTTDRLARLAQVATYTKAGKGKDVIRRELGLEVGDAAQAAAEMQTIIDVEVLPLLKPTFGAAFTVNEGEWLRNTMGNPNLSPEEKISQIQARVRGWDNQLKSLETKLGVSEGERIQTQAPKTIKWNDF